MNVEHQPHQFLNICKICKKVYKDKGGLMDHQRLQHSQDSSPSQQLSQVHQMNRFHKEVISRKISGGGRNFTGKDERFNNGEPTSAASSIKNLRMESYATLQKPPASLKPKLLQSRAIQLAKKDPSSSPISGQPSKSPFDFEDNEGEAEEWKKWEPEKEKDLGAMIITASVAHSTAACYSPTGQSNKKPFPDIDKETLRPQILTSAAPDLPHKGILAAKRNEMTKFPLPPQQTGVPLLGSISTKSPSSINNNNNNNNVATGSVRPPHKTVAGIPTPPAINKFSGRIPIPKLMSKTKAQFQILKSQATRPKILPRNSVNNALPRVGDPTTLTTISPPKLTKQADLPLAINQARFQNPPQLLRELGSNKSKLTETPEILHPREGRGGRRLPPPRTRATPMNTTSTINPGKSRGGARGRPRGRGGYKRGGLPHNVRRESLQSPSGSDSGCSDHSDDVMKDPSDSVDPPPAKKPVKSSRTEDEERIFGSEYKCPPVGKVASYLNKKGIRIWICLVCEQTEEEISRGPMICCDTCEDWYHFSCVGIDDEPPDDEKWYCKRCIYKKLQNKLHKTNGRGKKKSRGVSRGKKRS